MIHYVAGFAFSTNKKMVLLIEKLKPTWQVGKLNGIGGKIELGETPEHAIRREFKEETGLDIEYWEPYVTLSNNAFIVYFYRAFTNDIFNWKPTEEEEPCIIHIEDLYEYPVISNLRWLIPLALEDTVYPTKVTMRDPY